MLREFGEAAGHVFSQMNTGMRDSRLHGSQPAWPGDLHCELEQLVEKVAKQQTVLDCDKLRLAAIAGNTVHYFWSQRRESWHSDLGVIP